MTEEEAEMLGHADAEDFGIADREAQPWAFGWYDHGGRKHVYPYLPTVFNPNLADGDGPIFPLYAHPPADTLADLQTEASPVADNSDIATIAYLAGAKDARDKLAALQAHADALAGYGEHTSTCDIMTHGVWSDPTPCTCGWGATFRAYEAFKAGEPT